MPVTSNDLRQTLLARSRACQKAADQRRDAAVSGIRVAAAQLVEEDIIGAAWLIGSAAWGGFGPRSDVDLVVRGLAAEGRGAVEARLSESTGTHVDVLRWEEIDDGFCQRVVRDGVRLS